MRYIALLYFICLYALTPLAASSARFERPLSGCKTIEAQQYRQANFVKYLYQAGRPKVFTNDRIIALGFILFSICFLPVSLLPWTGAFALRMCLTMFCFGGIMYGFWAFFKRRKPTSSQKPRNPAKKTRRLWPKGYTEARGQGTAVVG